MKILAIGDPHGDLKKIKKIPLKNVDLILLTGDLGKSDLARKSFFESEERKKKGLPELEEDVDYIKESTMEIYDSTIKLLTYLSKFAPIYTIIGNVWSSDAPIKRDEKKYKICLPHLHEDIKKLKNFSLVKNVVRRFSGLRVGFLEYFVDNCWIKEFEEKDEKRIKNAKKDTEKAKRVLKRFSNDLDILLCHQPPYKILDKINFPGAPESHQGKHAGSKVILDYIKKYQPKYVFCGHIHEAEGKAKIGKTEIYNLGQAGHKIIECNHNKS